MADRREGKILPAKRLEAGLLCDLFCKRIRLFARAGMHKDKRHLLALAPDVVHRARIFGVNDREGREWRGSIDNPGNHRPMIVDLDHLAERQLFARPHEFEASPVDDHCVRLFQLFDRAEHHLRRNANKRRIVDTKQYDLLQLPVAGMRHRQSLIKRHGPADAIDPAHTPKLAIGHGFDLIDIFDARVHDPDVCLPYVQDLARRAQHQPGKNRDLVRHQHGREGEAEDEAEIFGAIAEEHFERYAVHLCAARF
jgi:hypothetical protein